MKDVCTKRVFCDYCMKYVFAAISHSWYHTSFCCRCRCCCFCCCCFIYWLIYLSTLCMFFRIKLGIWNISFLESKFFLENENRKESRKEPLPTPTPSPSKKRSFLLLFYFSFFVLFCFVFVSFFNGKIGNWVKLFNNYSSCEHRQIWFLFLL